MSKEVEESYIISISDKHRAAPLSGPCSGWVLYEKRSGINPKTKEPAVGEKESYYPNLRQLTNAVIEAQAKECKNLSEIKELLESIKKTLDKYPDSVFLKGGA